MNNYYDYLLRCGYPRQVFVERACFRDKYILTEIGNQIGYYNPYYGWLFCATHHNEFIMYYRYQFEKTVQQKNKNN